MNTGVFRTRLMTAAHLDKVPPQNDGGCIKTLVCRLHDSCQYSGLHVDLEDPTGDELTEDPQEEWSVV